MVAGPSAQQKSKLEQDISALQAKTDQRAAAQPNNVAVQHSAARFALQLGDNRKALELAQRAVQLAQASGDQRAFRRTLITLSMARAASKDYAGACSDAQRVLMDEPNNATAAEMRLFNCNRPDKGPSLQASDTFRWLAQQSPTVPHDPQEWARLEQRQRTPGFAAVSASMQALRGGDLAAALRHADEAVAADGGDPMAWAQRGLTRSKMGDFNGAILDLSRALAMGMVWNVLYRLRAQALIKAKQYQAAIGDASIALSLDPKDAAAYAARGTAKLGAGMQPSDILADFGAAARLDPADYRAAFERAKGDLGSAAEGAAPSDGSGDGLSLTPEQREALARDVPGETSAGSVWAWVAGGVAVLALVLGWAALDRRRSRDSGIP